MFIRFRRTKRHDNMVNWHAEKIGVLSLVALVLAVGVVYAAGSVLSAVLGTGSGLGLWTGSVLFVVLGALLVAVLLTLGPMVEEPKPETESDADHERGSGEGSEPAEGSESVPAERQETGSGPEVGTDPEREPERESDRESGPGSGTPTD